MGYSYPVTLHAPMPRPTRPLGGEVAKYAFLAIAVLIGLANCSRSPLPAVDFPTVPRDVAQDARYGVVTSHEATLTLTLNL